MALAVAARGCSRRAAAAAPAQTELATPAVFLLDPERRAAERAGAAEMKYREDDGLDVAAAAPQKLSLQVSDPALLLNHMAERYANTSRILMEFVDNGFDDAERWFDPQSGAYERPVS